MLIAKFKDTENWTEEEQIAKISEEVEEFFDAKIKKHKLEEAIDIIQAVMTYLFVAGFDKSTIELGLTNHVNKLNQRNREKQVDIEKWIVF